MGRPVSELVDTLRRTQHLPRDELSKYQRGLLEKLIRHARAHVPFYRDTGRLRPLFRRDDSIDWERWNEVPLLTRRDVQIAGEALCAIFVPPEHGKSAPISTSGSTAEPITVWHSQLSNPTVRAAVTIRNLERNGIDPNQRLAFLYPFAAEHFNEHPVGPRLHRNDSYSELGLTGERYDLADTRPPGELIDELIAIRPKFIRAQPVVLELLCAYDGDRRLAALDVAVVFSVGEHMPQEVKRDVAAHFGCWIVDSYGSVECGRMAHSCPECGRFHVEAETVLVEINREDGSPALPGETGWVVATPLCNYAMPLIRYDHVDRAIQGELGKCQIALPALDAIFGKERTAFVFPGGIAIRPTVPTSAVIRYLGAQAFQVAQIAEDRCEFRIVPGRLAPSEMRFDDVTQIIRSMWWSELQIDYKIVSELPRRSARGKLASVVREYTPSDATAAARVRSGQG